MITADSGQSGSIVVQSGVIRGRLSSERPEHEKGEIWSQGVKDGQCLWLSTDDHN